MLGNYVSTSIRGNVFPGGVAGAVFPGNPAGSAVLTLQQMLLEQILGAETSYSLQDSLHSTFVMTTSPLRLLIKDLNVPSFLDLSP